MAVPFDYFAIWIDHVLALSIWVSRGILANRSKSMRILGGSAGQNHFVLLDRAKGGYGGLRVPVPPHRPHYRYLRYDENYLSSSPYNMRGGLSVPMARDLD